MSACRECHAKPALMGGRVCADCKALYKQRWTERADREGLCRKCGAKGRVPGASRCASCVAEREAYNRRRSATRAFAGARP